MYSKINLIAIIFIWLSLSAIAQQKTNIEKLNQLSDQFTDDWNIKQAKVIEYAAANNLKVRVEKEDGQIIQLVDIENGIPVYISTTNLGAAITARTDDLWEGGALDLNLSGENYNKLGEWDGGKVRTSHQEFNDGGSTRVTQMDNTSGISDHATHVAGTMIAAGVNANAKGMAYGGELKAWDWNSDLAEMASAAANGLEISNHSYSFLTGWNYNNGWVWTGNSNISPTEDYRFGFYSSLARSADIVAVNAPNYLITIAAANNRGEGPGNAGQSGNPEKDGGEDGYDCLAYGYSTSKNVLTVGAVYELLNYNGPDDVTMSSFSGWGPADDGRIKPDVVAKGVDVYSPVGNSNNSYSSYDGTSMSTPSTSGTMALLQQYYQSMNNGMPMRSSTLKALVIHTTDEAGDNPGPDYIFGWGLINASGAIQKITEDQGQNVIDELTLQENDTYVREINVPEGLSELKVTICWTDPAGIPVSPQLDPLDPMLINDLDLYIIDDLTNTYYPYKLDPLNPTIAATQDSKNAVDNVEMVYLSNPNAGNYTIYVSHDGTLSGNNQDFSLIISGIDEYQVVPGCANTLISPENNSNNVAVNQWISWVEAPYASSYDIYFGTDGGGTNTPTNVYNGENFSDNGFSTVLEVNTTYYLQVIPRNTVGPAENCNAIWTFTTIDAISIYPYIQDVEDVTTPELPDFWSTQNYSEIDWISTSVTSNSGNNSMGCYSSNGLNETDMDNWFISPPLLVENGITYPVSFYYRSFLPNHDESLSVYWGLSPDPAELNNILFEGINFSTSGWEMAEINMTPGIDGIVFIGWHAVSTGGYGVFLDDMKIETGTTTNMPENSTSNVNVYYNGNDVIVKADDSWINSDLLIYDMMGKLVYIDRYIKPTTIQINENKGTGIYFVSLSSRNNIFTKKVFLIGN
jgi:hypothetical protein